MKILKIKFILLMGLVSTGMLLTLSAPNKTLAAGIPCYDITGSSTQVSVGGTANSGVLNFDDAGVDPTVQACVRMNATLDKPDHLEGWVWDNNLGWISLYCKNGTNLGKSCGARDYQVNVNTTGTGPNFSAVQLSGWAWGDNTGYISFSCAAEGNSGYSCGSSATYGLSPKAGDPNRGRISGSNAATMIWSDAVGWFDLSGVTLDWTGSLVVNNVTVPVDPTAGAGKPVPADGSSSWTITIPFGTDLNNIENCGSDKIDMTTTSVSGKQYCAYLKLDWHDSVDYLQTTGDSQNENPSGVDPFDTTNSGAAVKPLSYDFTAKSGSGLSVSAVTNLVGTVKSWAPTSDKNMSDGLSNEKFYFVDPTRLNTDTHTIDYDMNKSNQNVLKLARLTLMLFKYSAGSPALGTCVIGDTISTPGKCSAVIPVQDKTISFEPLVKVSKLVYKKPLAGGTTKDLNYIEISDVNAAQNFQYQIDNTGASSPTVDFKTGLMSEDPYYLMFVNSFQVNWLDHTHAFDMFSGVVGGLQSFVTQVMFDPEKPGAAFSAAANPYVFTKVTYSQSGHTITYFANKLPRVKAGLLVNPVAKVQGNVYATDIGKKTSDVTIRSLGNVSSNLKREQVLRNVSKYLRGFTGTAVTGNISLADLNSPSGLTELLPGKVYYLKNGDLTINCGATCNYEGYKTFIVDNGNIYVKSNIQLRSGKQGQIGLIALRDLTSTAKDKGSMLVSANVTWMQNVNVYLDRLMMSYDSTACAGGLDDNGILKCSGDDLARQGLFNNQLVFEGTISSMNGIGNASKIPPVDENGTVVSGYSCSDYGTPPVSGICRARVADLNYMRYYGPGLQICQDSEGTGAVAGIPMDQTTKGNVALGGGCDPNTAVSGYDIDATCVYDASHPTCDLVLGGAGSGVPSPYFNGSTAIGDQFPVNFFYKPIAKDLAGFETEINLNPLIQN